MIYALLGTGAAGALGITILTAMYFAVKKDLVSEQAAHAATRTKLAAATAAVQISETGRSGENARLEAIITHLKEEIATLETQKSADPADLRARLERLSGG